MTTKTNGHKRMSRCYVVMILMAVLLLVSIISNIFMFNLGNTHFRLHNIVRLDPLQLDYYPAAPPLSEGKLRVVFFGDSRALSWSSPSGPAGVEYVNRGIGFQTTAQVLGRFEQHVSTLSPQVIVLQVGINDLKNIPVFPEDKNKIVQNVKENIRAIVRKSREIGAKVVLTTIFPLGDVPLHRIPFWSDDVASAVVDVNRYIASLKSKNVIIFDSASILADDNGVCKSEYQYDLLHLVEDGYDALNRELVKTIGVLNKAYNHRSGKKVESE